MVNARGAGKGELAMRNRFLASVGLMLAFAFGVVAPSAAIAGPARADQIVAMLPMERAALGIVSTYRVQDGDSLSGIGGVRRA